MPVIGRLDRQVDDVLIDPVARRRRDEGDDTRAPSNDAQPRATDIDARGATHVANDEAARSDDARSRASDEEQLPVWLL